MILKRFLLLFLLSVSFFGFSVVAFAVDGDGSADDGVRATDDGVRATVLPDTDKSVTECQIIMEKVIRDPSANKELINKRLGTYTTILACGIKTGNIPLWMVPFYLRWILEFIIALAGLASVGGLVLGGYMYLFSGISNDKERGKNALKNSVIGLVLTLTAWAIVNILLALLTG